MCGDVERFGGEREAALALEYAHALSTSADMRGTITRFLRDAQLAGLSVPETIDLFCVSTPNIVEESGLDPDGQDAAVELLDELLVTLRWL